MSWLHYLNPLHSLFGRIFLWFWLATVVMIVALTVVNRQLNDDFQVEKADKRQAAVLDKFAQRISRVGNFPLLYSRDRLLRVLRNPRLTGERLVVLIARKGHRIVASRRLPPFMRSADILPLALREELSQMTTPTHTFFGAKLINISGKDYWLVMGEAKPFQSPMERFQSQDPSIRIAIAIAISGLFCFLLAWSLIKPIRRLQTVSKRLADGDTKAKVLQGCDRSDELGQLSRDFNAMAERIDQLLGSEKRLLGDISHELRTPLTRLQLAVGLAQESSKEDLAKHLQRIETEALRIDAMIAQVLQLSRLESQPERVNKSLTDLDGLIQGVVDDANFEAKALGKSVNYQGANVNPCMLDAQLIASAIENIVRNAIKYTDEGTSVDLELTEMEHLIEINITDHGPGVPEEELSSLFRPFYRVSASRQRQSGGTGLGLAIAERAVHVHQGKISAENLPQGGLSVTIQLPIESSEKPEHDQS